MVAAKLLGKSKPVAGNNATLYTVPGGAQAQLNLFACNQGAGASKIRVALVESGSLSLDDYIVYDFSLPASLPYPITGIALNAGDSITVRSDTGDVSFVATGLEIT